MEETQVGSLGQEDPLEEGMVTHSSTLAWRIPWTEEPGRLQSTGHVELDMSEETENTCTHVYQVSSYLYQPRGYRGAVN